MYHCSKKTLAYVNLQNPEMGEDRDVTRITRQSKWDVSCVQFNPHASHAHLFVTAVSDFSSVAYLVGGWGGSSGKVWVKDVENPKVKRVICWKVMGRGCCTQILPTVICQCGRCLLDLWFKHLGWCEPVYILEFPFSPFLLEGGEVFVCFWSGGGGGGGSCRHCK